MQHAEVSDQKQQMNERPIKEGKKKKNLLVKRRRRKAWVAIIIGDEL